jgi:hypothetical protein
VLWQVAKLAVNVLAITNLAQNLPPALNGENSSPSKSDAVPERSASANQAALIPVGQCCALQPM